MKPDVVCVCHHPGETRLPYGRLGTLLSERGQGLALLGPASMSRQNDQCWHRTTRTEHRIYGILSVSRETCIRASRFSCCSRGSRVPSFEEGRAMNARCYRPRRCASSATRGKQRCPPRHRHVWTLMHRQGCRHIRTWSMHAQYSAIVFHVKPAVCRSLTRFPPIRRQLHDGRGVECQLVRWPSIRVQPSSA